MTGHYSLLLLCCAVALCVNYAAHRIRGIRRKGYGTLAIGLVSGFAGFVVSLMIATRYQIQWAALGTGVSALFAYFFASAQAFEAFARRREPRDTQAGTE